METKDIIDILFTTVGHINHQWNLYFVGIIALGGWVFSRKSIIRTNLKIVMSAVALFFISTHLWTLGLYYEMFDVYVEELKSSVEIDPFNNPNTKKFIEGQHDTLYYWNNTYWVFHIVIDAIIFAVIWFDRIWLTVGERESDD